MIVDAVMLRDELDLLEARLMEFDDLVDRFVIVEGELQFGDAKRKPLWFAEHRRRFDAWADRITHVIVYEGEYPFANGWGREFYQRNRITDGLEDLEPDDIVMLGDVDEFPARADIISGFLGVCSHRHLLYAPNLEHPVRTIGTTIVRTRDAWSPQKVRDDRYNLPRTESGFHFSWHPGCEPISAKVAASAHTEFAHLSADDARTARRAHWDGTVLTEVKPDETWPRWFRSDCPAWWFA